MSPNELLQLQREKPFTGLRIYITDGASYEVRHPEMMLVTSRRVYIAVPPLKEGVPSTGVHCDPLHITRVEPLNGDRKKRIRKS